MEIKINVYRSGGEWYGARWIDGEYDGCDSLGLDATATESAAMEAAREMPLTVTGERTVTRVADPLAPCGNCGSTGSTINSDGRRVRGCCAENGDHEV